MITSTIDVTRVKPTWVWLLSNRMKGGDCFDLLEQEKMRDLS